MRVVLRAAFTNADAAALGRTVVKAFPETDAGPDDGATDVTVTPRLVDTVDTGELASACAAV